MNKNDTAFIVAARYDSKQIVSAFAQSKIIKCFNCKEDCLVSIETEKQATASVNSFKICCFECLNKLNIKKPNFVPFSQQSLAQMFYEFDQKDFLDDILMRKL